MNKFKLKNAAKRIVIMCISISMVFPLGVKAKAVTNTPVFTDYQPTINESIDASGFKHPGVGLTKDTLENMRAEILAQKEPWHSYYKAVLVSSSASKSIASSNESLADSTKPANFVFNSQSIESLFISDGLKAYTQALLYYITGDETYRANAMHIIRIWSQMDPTKYSYYTDACIHAGIPLNRMVTAAEILRYSSCKTEALKWTEKDTNDFTKNLINPTIDTFLHDNNHFMNQHLYPLLGATAGYIFTGNKDRYNEAVEWFTVNKTALDQGQNGSIKQLFRLVDTDIVTGEKLDNPRVQHAEMGRDQAHGSGDLTNTAIISRMLIAQGTKVDPNDGTISTNANAVGPYEFLNNRILKASNYFWQYMLGYDTPWTPLAAHTDSNGNPTIIYKQLSDSYRGRMNTAQFWDIYYYYKYTLGVDVAKEAPYFDEAFHKRLPSNYYYQGSLVQAWDSVDGGGDFWLYLPSSVENEGDKNLPKEQTDSSLIQIEDRYTAFDGNSVTKTEGNTSFIETNATEGGSKFAPLNLSYPDRTKSCIIGLKFRTNGIAKLEMSKDYNSTPYINLTLPDTKGQWAYITFDMNINNVSYSQIDKDYSIQYFNVKGSGTTVDIDALNVKAGTQLIPPVFKSGNKDLNLFSYIGATIPITYDFSSVDSNASDKVTYKIDNKPDGVVLDPSTGAFSWSPTQAGAYSFVVSASDGTTVSTKNVSVLVGDNRKSAVEAVIASYNENTSYESASLDAYKKVYNDVISKINGSSDYDFYQCLANLKNAVDNLKLLTPLLKDGSIDFPSTVTSTAGDYTKTLTDNNNNSYPAYGLAPDLYHIFDFGPNFRVSATAFKLQVRMSFPERLAGSAVFGSNDGDQWTRLTSETTKFNEDMQTLQVEDKYKNTQFRFIKVQIVAPQPSLDLNIKTNMMEMSEFRIFGQRYEIMSKFDSISISSPQSFYNRVIPENTVKLSFKTKEEVNNVKVKVQGQDASVSTVDSINWTADVVLNKEAQLGKIKFTINYKTKDGIDGPVIDYTTDNSKLLISNDDDIINNVVDIANLIDPTSNRATSVTLTNVKNLFDKNGGTISDFRAGTNGIGGYITFDFKDGNQVTLSKIELLSRQDSNFGRIKGVVVEGSNDNTKWSQISDTAASGIIDWQTLNISSKVPYRYIRLINYNLNGWYGNMAEVRFHGVVKAADLTSPVTNDDAPKVWVNKDTKVNFNATDSDSGVQATYFKVDYGAQQTGNSVTLTSNGIHNIAYWSTDYAGNTEQCHNVTVKLDKTAPEITVNGIENSDISDALSIVPDVSIDDKLSGIDNSKTQVLLDGKTYQIGEKIDLYLLQLGTHTLTVNGSDLAGNSTSKIITFKTYASIDGLKQLIKSFSGKNYIDNPGISNSLEQKLNNNDLKSFIKEVQAQNGKHINSTAQKYLLRDALSL